MKIIRFAIVFFLLSIAFGVGAEDNIIQKEVWIKYEGGKLWIKEGNPSLDIVDVLKRCREFITDYRRSSFLSGSTIEMWEQKSIMEEIDEADELKIKRIKSKMEKRHREQELRNDIETIIELLKDERN